MYPKSSSRSGGWRRIVMLRRVWGALVRIMSIIISYLLEISGVVWVAQLGPREGNGLAWDQIIHLFIRYLSIHYFYHHHMCWEWYRENAWVKIMSCNLWTFPYMQCGIKTMGNYGEMWSVSPTMAMYLLASLSQYAARVPTLFTQLGHIEWRR